MSLKLQHKMLRRDKCLIGAMAMVCSGLVQAADISPGQQEALRIQIIEQTNRLDTLRQQMAEADAKLSEIKRALGIEKLRNTRGGTAASEEGRVREFSSFEIAQAPSMPQIPPVGQAPQSSSRDDRPPEVAPIFNQPGVLTPRGRFVFEPGFQYSYSSSNRVSLIGYTIIPALTIGLIDVREVKRNTFTANLTGRWGITNRFEIEAKLPYVYRSDSVISRPLTLTPSSQDQAFAADGSGVGDFEVTGRYQFNDGGLEKPYYIGSLRLKSRTGKDPFEVLTDDAANPNAHGLQTELPTGSGFYTIQPGLTFLYPSDPAVFFGGISYQYNAKRGNVKGHFTSGDKNLGDIDPGDVIGFNFGMGLALNDRSSFSIGYDHSSVGKTKVDGRYALNAVRTELGTLLLGYAHRLKDKTSLNLSVGVGVTRDTPDITLSLRLPTSF
ncbi:MAG: acetate kinase [Azonexus sp.]|nr:acetate kinase [Azonexus sp.]